MMERGGERGGGTRCARHASVVSRGGPWRGVVTAGPADRGGSPRRNQEFNHEWPRNQRRAVTSSEPGHPLPPGALPTTAPPLVSYINILFTSIRAAITRRASLYSEREGASRSGGNKKRVAQPKGVRAEGREKEGEADRVRMTSGRHVPRIVLITRGRSSQARSGGSDHDLEARPSRILERRSIHPQILSTKDSNGFCNVIGGTRLRYLRSFRSIDQRKSWWMSDPLTFW